MSEHHDDNKKPQIIIIKKTIKKAAHHGGSWKIAYADFVTAMMAFFLLMWLLSMLNKFQLMGISSYFKKPLKEVFVENKKNDNEVKKIPKDQTKKYHAASNQPTPSHNIHPAAQEKLQKTTPMNVISKDLKEASNIQNLKEHLESSLENNKDLAKYKEQLDFTIVKDGLKISLRDLENKPMFSLGKTDFESYAKPILNWLGNEIKKSNCKIMIIGFTDTYQYDKNNEYSNWELSADRANATRRILIKYGVDSQQVIRIAGAADSVLLDKKFGGDPTNRRIEIILLNQKAVNKLLSNE